MLHSSALQMRCIFSQQHLSLPLPRPLHTHTLLHTVYSYTDNKVSAFMLCIKSVQLYTVLCSSAIRILHFAAHSLAFLFIQMNIYIPLLFCSLFYFHPISSGIHNGRMENIWIKNVSNNSRTVCAKMVRRFKVQQAMLLNKYTQLYGTV